VCYGTFQISISHQDAGVGWGTTWSSRFLNTQQYVYTGVRTPPIGKNPTVHCINSWYKLCVTKEISTCACYTRNHSRIVFYCLGLFSTVHKAVYLGFSLAATNKQVFPDLDVLINIQSSRCSYCTVPYTVIAKAETFDEDRRWNHKCYWRKLKGTTRVIFQIYK
jgi:hypothetical protein